MFLSYRSSTTIGNTVQIQHIQINQRTAMFSAPVRSSLGSSLLFDQQRISTSSTSFRRPLNHHLSQTNSTISIYDVSILLPVSKKLAVDYKLDFKNLIDMCERNQQLTKRMGKDELAHCWGLLAGLLTLQPTLKDDHPWFQSPIAQGKKKHKIYL